MKKRVSELTVGYKYFKRYFQLTTYNLSQKRGFTLMEMIIYVAGLLIFVTILSEVFASIIEVQQESQTVSSVEEDGRFILSRLSNDIQQASSVSLPATPGASSATLQISVNADNYSYSLQNGNLNLTNASGTNQLNGFDTAVSGLSFTRIGNAGGKNSIRMQYTLTSKSVRKKGPEVKTFQTAVTLR